MLAISPPVGALNNYLAKLMSGQFYAKAKKASERVLSKMPPIKELAKRAGPPDVAVVEHREGEGEDVETLGEPEAGLGHDVAPVLDIAQFQRLLKHCSVVSHGIVLPIPAAARVMARRVAALMSFW